MSKRTCRSWISKFCRRVGNEYFCKVDGSFVADMSNIAGLERFVPNMKYYARIILDNDTAANESDEEMAGHLYGLIHARYILTEAGIKNMICKYYANVFGLCPRIGCGESAMLPIGLSDEPGCSTVKLYCPKCMDIYNPTSCFPHMDGAYFGTSFPQMLFMNKPEIRPIPRPSSKPRTHTHRSSRLSINRSSSSSISHSTCRPKFRSMRPRTLSPTPRSMSHSTRPSTLRSKRRATLSSSPSTTSHSTRPSTGHPVLRSTRRPTRRPNRRCMPRSGAAGDGGSS